jgi:hypothetical protein
VLAVLTLLALVAVAWGLHRFCVALEERGYLYYRKKPEGGGTAAGLLADLDRLTRPSIQHVVETKDEARRTQDDEEGETDD